jgi:hypothetical protein
MQADWLCSPEPALADLLVAVAAAELPPAAYSTLPRLQRAHLSVIQLPYPLLQARWLMWLIDEVGNQVHPRRRAAEQGEHPGEHSNPLEPAPYYPR